MSQQNEKAQFSDMYSNYGHFLSKYNSHDTFYKSQSLSLHPAVDGYQQINGQDN